MIRFHSLFSFFFKSFRIDSEVQLLKKIQSEWLTEVSIIKRSWVFILLICWLPLLLSMLLLIATYITFVALKDMGIISTITSIFILISLVLFLFTQAYYLFHFRKLHKHVEVSTDIARLIAELQVSDTFFIKFFNWSYTIQLCIFITLLESIYMFFLIDSLLKWGFIALEMMLLMISFYLVSHYRKKVIDLEMDYNVVTQWKIYFVNQSGLLSQIQTIESDKIKSIQAVYPNKVAALFNFGTIHVLTEGDDKSAMGTMSMYYVKSPEVTVEMMQKILTKK